MKRKCLFYQNNEKNNYALNITHLYIHVPYCSKLCYYCDFHFSLNLKTRAAYVDAVCKELKLRRNWGEGEIDTLYFGGGTPSLLQEEELVKIFSTIRDCYHVSSTAEVSFECNPDDVTKEYCRMLRSLGVNRLSIGIQSFFDEDLQMLNRRHLGETARQSVAIAQGAGFQNITVDLIYGLPQMTLERWQQNLAEVERLNVQHLSAYSLMVEPHTALNTFVRRGTYHLPAEESVLEQFNYLMDWSAQTGFEQYEISNFAKSGMYSRHNSSYWSGEAYLGVGPSAHSYDGEKRYWNIAHNVKYIAALKQGIIPCEAEILSLRDKYNEMILTGLRTKGGVCYARVKSEFPPKYLESFNQHKNTYVTQGLLQERNGSISLTRKGIMLSDMIMSDFFVME